MARLEFGKTSSDVGDSVQIGRLRLTVAELKGRAIEWVEIELLTPEESADPEGTS